MRILVLGGLGMLGHQVVRKLVSSKEEFVVGTTIRSLTDPPSFGKVLKAVKCFENVDVSDFPAVQRVIESFQPEVIVNCIGITLRKENANNLVTAIDINSMFPHRLALFAQKRNIRVIHFSTDCVFDGKNGPYFDFDLPSAPDIYGKSKFLGEISYPNSLTLRLSIIGRELYSRTELIEWFLTNKGKAVQGYGKMTYSGLTTNFVADEVIKIIKFFPNLFGVYQVSSEPITKFELLRIVNEVYGAGIEVVENFVYESNKVLDASRYIKATGFVCPQWNSMIRQMKNEENGLYD